MDDAATLKFKRLVMTLLIAYLLVLGVGAAVALVGNFPPAAGTPAAPCRIWLVPICATETPEQRLMLLAFLAGMVGSFLHAAQSLATYIGNNDFKMSWTAWYVLRPWVGGVLGFT